MTKPMKLQHISSRFGILKRVTLFTMATALLAGKMTTAAHLSWDIVWASAVVATVTPERNLAFSAPHNLTSIHLQSNDSLIPEINTIINEKPTKKYVGPESNEERTDPLANEHLRKEIKDDKMPKIFEHGSQITLPNYYDENPLFDTVRDESEIRFTRTESRKCPDRHSICDCNEYIMSCDDLNIDVIQFPNPLSNDIKRFSANGNRLKEIPYIYGSLELTEISFARNSIKYANVNNLASFILLEKLDLSHNELDVIDLTTVQFRNLRVLNLSYNKLRSVVSLPSNLTDFYLDANNLSDLSFLSNFTRLKNINLSNNRIKIVPTDAFHHLTNLVSLDLSKNQIEEAEFLFNLPKVLAVLNLNHNRITNIRGLAFKNMRMEKLYLDNNHLTDISFVNYLNVAVLSVGKNPLFEINPKYFENFGNLKTLNVSGTNLSSMDFITSIPGLITLDIENNNVTYIPDNLVKNYPTLKYWFLRNNPFKNLRCHVSSDWNKRSLCNLSSHDGRILIQMESKDINQLMSCVLRNRDSIRYCEQKNNVSSQVSVPINLLIFSIVINVVQYSGR